MSEFQYYDFYCIDSWLSEETREEISRWSSRTNPTVRRAIFTYSYSDFPMDERMVLVKYFDAFLYMANWGTKRLIFKIPKDKFNMKHIKHYNTNRFDGFEDAIKIYSRSKYVIIEISDHNEDGGWIENETSYLMELSSLRGDVINNDYRFLFLIWLNVIRKKYSHGELDLSFKFDLRVIPDNLGTLNGGLASLINFFEIDRDWVLGAQNSKIKSLESGMDKFDLTELLEQVNKQIKKRKELERKKERRAFLKKMKSVEANKLSIKKEINLKLKRGTGKSYDEALRLILDLKELALHQGEEKEYKKFLSQFKKKASGRPAMIKRIENAAEIENAL